MSTNDTNIVPRDKLAKFELTEESLNSFRKNNNIPLDLYNKDGQILIHKKRNPSEADFGKLLKFEMQGVYFLISELKKSRPAGHHDHAFLEPGRTTKLFDQEKTSRFAKQSQALIEDLRKTSFSSDQAVFVQNSVNELLTDFTSNPDYELGIFNILEILGVAGVSVESELMTKRTVVAMGMKVRTKKIVNEGKEESNKKDHLSLMMASYLADVGYSRLDIKNNPKLTKEEYAVVQQHPIISYLMTLPAPEIDSHVRTLILNHHRPYRGNGVNNNFPDPRSLFSKLMSVRDKYNKEVGKERITQDIELQLHLQENNVTSSSFEEDIAILSLASEYASLTSNQPWRPAFKSSTALKMILNDSFFSYSNKNIRHLLDYVGSSLTNNENIVNFGDFVITASVDSERRAHFDICIVLDVGRYQTRPKLQRICSINPIFQKGNKFKIADFDLRSIKIDRRKAIMDLALQAGTSRVIYIIDPELNPALHEAVYKINMAS